MGVSKSLGMTVGRFRSALGLLGEEAVRYRQMAYGLFLSRGISDGNREWTVSREHIINYIEFHLDGPCDRSALSVAMGCFDCKDGYFYFPKSERRRKKLSRLKKTGKYRYQNAVATSIANTKLVNLQAIAAPFEKETVRKYYQILRGLLTAVKEGVTADGIKNYMAYHLHTACDRETLEAALRSFSRIPGTSGRTYRFESNAVTLYLQRKVFPEQKEQLPGCPLAQIYRICYPEITEQLQAEYQALMDTVDPEDTDAFAQGMEKIRHRYGEPIGTQYLRQQIRERFFAGDRQVRKMLVSRLEMALQKQKNEAAAASVTLRSMKFAAAGEEGDYTSFSRQDCRAFLLKNRDAANEMQLAKEIEDIQNCNIFDCGDSVFVATVDFWMPDLQTDSYYTDALCYHYRNKQTASDL